jgi:biopolymer transport protein ExbD
MGKITMGGSERTLEDVDRLLALAIRDNPRQSVVIRGDRNAIMQDAVDVLSLCEKHGIDRTYLTTTQAGRK